MFSLVTLVLSEFAHYRVNYVNVMALMQCAYISKWRLENIISVCVAFLHFKYLLLSTRKRLISVEAG